MTRILILGDLFSETVAVFDKACVDYDFDSGDRFLISDDDAQVAIRLLDENGINYEII